MQNRYLHQDGKQCAHLVQVDRLVAVVKNAVMPCSGTIHECGKFAGP